MAQTPTSQPAPGNGQRRTPAEQKLAQHSLDEPRAIAAAVVAADKPSPKYITSVGSNLGAFLSVFLDKFPNARGQWTEPVDKIAAAKAQYLGKYGDRVDYKIGCPDRNITDGCVPRQTDVLITDWIKSHQGIEGFHKIFNYAYDQLPKGGWIVDIDLVSFPGTAWGTWLQTAEVAGGFRPSNEGPRNEHNDRLPTESEILGAMRDAGFDAQVVWRSFDCSLLMGRKDSSDAPTGTPRPDTVGVH
jgi:hypothetical protein